MIVYLHVDEKEAVKIGNEQVGVQSVDINLNDLTPEQRSELAEWMNRESNNGKKPFLHSVYGGYLIHRNIAIASKETVLSVLDDFISARKKEAEKEEKENQTREKQISDWLNMPDELKLEPRPLDDEWRIINHISFSLRKNRLENEYNNEYARLDKICKARNAEIRKAKKEKGEKEEQEKEEKERRKHDQLTNVVNQYGDQSQQERWAAGVLARSEAIGLLWEQTFSPLKTISIEYLHIGYHLPEIENWDTDSTEKKALTAEQWETVKKIKTVLPSANLIYYHQYYTDNENCDSIDIVRIGITIGEYELCADVII